MMQFDTLTKKFAAWKEARFLKKHGCKTRKQYERMYDPKVNFRGYRMKDIYGGYSAVIPIENPQHEVYTNWGPGFSIGLEMMSEWCEKNCKGEWRFDWHQVDKDTFGNYYPSCMGDDLIFFAFTDPNDATWFSLRW